MERQSVTVARTLLSIIEENWDESWLQGMLRRGGEPVPKELIPAVLEEMVILAKRKP